MGRITEEQPSPARHSMTAPFHLAKDGKVHPCRTRTPETDPPIGTWTARRQGTEWIVEVRLDPAKAAAAHCPTHWAATLAWPPKGAAFLQPANP